MHLNNLHALVLLLLPAASARKSVVDLGYTQYQGHELSNGIVQWLGMRYAAPPVGQLRFAAPQDPLPIKGVQEANKVAIQSQPRCRKFPKLTSDLGLSTDPSVSQLGNTLWALLNPKIACSSMCMPQGMRPTSLCSSGYKVVGSTPIRMPTTMELG